MRPSKRAVNIDPKVAAKFQTLATLKGESLAKTVNAALVDWFEVSGETQLESITGIENPGLPQLPRLPKKQPVLLHPRRA